MINVKWIRERQKDSLKPKYSSKEKPGGSYGMQKSVRSSNMDWYSRNVSQTQSPPVQFQIPQMSPEPLDKQNISSNLSQTW